VIGVRPEDVSIAPSGLGAVVTVVESLGHERHVVCRLDDDQMVIVRQASDEPVPSEQEHVTLAAGASELHVFDAESGLRIDP
jgi:multiple sugar transport system ATP-binding protein